MAEPFNRNSSDIFYTKGLFTVTQLVYWEQNNNLAGTNAVQIILQNPKQLLSELAVRNSSEKNCL